MQITSMRDVDKDTDADSHDERVQKFYCTFFLLGGAIEFFFPTCKVVTGACSDRFVKNCEPWNTPKEWFLSRKRPKEGERVG